MAMSTQLRPAWKRLAELLDALEDGPLSIGAILNALRRGDATVGGEKAAQAILPRGQPGKA